MLIVGTGGFALESLEVLFQLNIMEDISFFNNVDPEFEFKIETVSHYPIIRNANQLSSFFKNNPEFILGIGNPKHRKYLYDMMISHGGVPASIVSPKAIIGNINNHIHKASNVMSGVVITSNVLVKKGCLINLNATIGHDSIIGEFVEICPAVNISGNCVIGDNVFIGTGTTILPNITIGENAVIAAGAIVIKNVDAYTMVAGNPAVVKKKLS